MRSDLLCGESYIHEISASGFDAFSRVVGDSVTCDRVGREAVAASGDLRSLSHSKAELQLFVADRRVGEKFLADGKILFIEGFLAGRHRVILDDEDDAAWKGLNAFRAFHCHGKGIVRSKNFVS